MFWYVYIAESKRNHYYVGISHNPSARLAKHNSGNGSRMAKQQGPFILKYVSGAFQDRCAARKRETQIKKWTREKKQKLIRGEWT